MLVGGANEIMAMKIFYYPQSNKLLVHYCYRCGGVWIRKCLKLGKVEPDGDGLGAFALGPSAQPAMFYHIQVITPRLPPFRPQNLSLFLPCLHLPPCLVIFIKVLTAEMVCLPYLCMSLC